MDRQKDLLNVIGTFAECNRHIFFAVFHFKHTKKKGKGEMVFELQYNIFNKMGQILKYVK
jgi:hypothetical protein